MSTLHRPRPPPPQQPILVSKAPTPKPYKAMAKHHKTLFNPVQNKDTGPSTSTMNLEVVCFHDHQLTNTPIPSRLRAQPQKTQQPCHGHPSPSLEEGSIPAQTPTRFRVQGLGTQGATKKALPNTFAQSRSASKLLAISRNPKP